MKLKIFLFTCLILVTGFASAQVTPEPAGKILDDACKLAAKDGKNVMIVFHASWCGWCKKFEASVTDPSCKNYFDKSFIIKYLDIQERAEKKNLENPGALDLYNKYGGDGGGIPFFLLFDKKGTLLADSKIKVAGASPEKAAQNIGCPASDEEVAEFIKILKKASTISDQEAKAVSERFRKNR